MKKYLKYILLFFLIFSISFILKGILEDAWCDEIWVYGFSYNISKGMVIYRDFNVLQTPLYFFLGSIFVKIFGNYLISLSILNSLIISFIFILVYRIIKWKAFFIIPIILIFQSSGYNMMCLLYLVLILYFINTKKDNDFLIAFICGLCLITKQNIGVCLFIPCFLYSKKKFKSVLVFLIPILLLSIYLIYHHAFYNFIDYCFLGIFNFNSHNRMYFLSCVIIEILSILFIIYSLFKSKFNNKELYYILVFQMLAYPLFDFNHTFPCFFPVMFYFVKNLNNKYVIVSIACIFWSFCLGLHYIMGFDISLEDNFLYLKNSNYLNNNIGEIKEYAGDLLEDSYFLTEYSYLIKLYYDIPISEYDFLLNGNMGYFSEMKIFDNLYEDCSKKKCLFFVYNEDIGQGTLFKDFVMDNYEKIDEVSIFDVYSSR